MAGKGHPKGLYLLFGVEMWERFSYYGMRALLMLYMLKALEFSTEKAGQVYGLYTGLVYLTPIIGGYVADRYWGQRKAIIVGGILMMLGHFAMAFQQIPMFYTALGLLIVGNGFFKPNISTVVGGLYAREDSRRDAAFTIFYMGINLGAFFSPLVCGTLGEKVGWHYGFSAAGIGMGLGLLLYLWGQNRFLGDVGRLPAYKSLSTQQKQASLTGTEKKQIAVIFILAFFTIFFWGCFEQAGSSMTLFADRQTDRHIFGFEFPASLYQSLNPILIFMLAPLFSAFWMKLSFRNAEPSSPMKFVWGLGLLAGGFVLMAAAAKAYMTNGLVSAWWLFGVYFLHTLGELCLSPVGLSVVTKLSPARFASLLMGTWFLSSFVANYAGGIFAGQYDNMDPDRFFNILAATAAVAALALLALVPLLKKWMKDDQPADIGVKIPIEANY